MDEIIKGLWIGDLISAKNVERLKKNKIYSVLSAMRGRINIRETFIHHQILLDDSEDADILVHLLPSIHFIQAELDKGRGVLVHCHAGISEAYFLSLRMSLNLRTGRSSTIVAAYLMYSRNLDPSSALELIRKARPNIECVLRSSPNFLFPANEIRCEARYMRVEIVWAFRRIAPSKSLTSAQQLLTHLQSQPRFPPATRDFSQVTIPDFTAGQECSDVLYGKSS
jgi:protein-tyrosine phosphatase